MPLNFITRYFKNIYAVRHNDQIDRHLILSCHYYFRRLFSLKIATLYEEHKQNGQEVSLPYATAHKSDILFNDNLTFELFFNEVTALVAHPATHSLLTNILCNETA